MQFKIHARSAIRQKLGFQDENRQEEIIRKRVFVEKEDSFIKGRLSAWMTYHVVVVYLFNSLAKSCTLF